MEISKVKVLLITPHFNLPGGVAEFNKLLVHFSSNSEFYVFSLLSSSKKTFFGKVLGGLIDRIRIIFFLQFKRIDIVQINPSLAKNAIRRDGYFIWISKVFDKRVLVHWHGWNPSNENLLTGKSLRYIKKTIFKANHIVFLSNESAQKLIDCGYKNQWSLGNTMVDNRLMDFTLTARNTDTIPNLLFLSTISKNKGIYTFLSIVEELQNRDVRFGTLIAGDGPELNDLKLLVQDKNLINVKFLGHVTELEKAETFNRSSIYLFPSSYEGMPTTVIEAMAFGLPVLCTKVGALPDFFENGKMGYFIDDLSDVETIANKVVELWNNKELHHTISLYNKLKVNEHYLATSTVSRIERLHQKIINE